MTFRSSMCLDCTVHLEYTLQVDKLGRLPGIYVCLIAQCLVVANQPQVITSAYIVVPEIASVPPFAVIGRKKVRLDFAHE